MIKLYYSKDKRYIVAEYIHKHNISCVEYGENITILKQKILYKLVNPKPNNNVYKYFWKLFYDKIKNIRQEDFDNKLEENIKDKIYYVLLN